MVNVTQRIKRLSSIIYPNILSDATHLLYYLHCRNMSAWVRRWKKTLIENTHYCIFLTIGCLSSFKQILIYAGVMWFSKILHLATLDTVVFWKGLASVDT